MISNTKKMLSRVTKQFFSCLKNFFLVKTFFLKEKILGPEKNLPEKKEKSCGKKKSDLAKKYFLGTGKKSGNVSNSFVFYFLAH